MFALTVGVVFAAFSLVLGSAAGAAPPTDDTSVTDLGPANFTVNVRQAEFGTLPDGSEVIFASSNGSPLTFTVLDMEGEQLHAEAIEGYELGGFILQDDDGTVYFTARTGSYAGLFTFDPAAMEITRLDVDLQGQRVLYGGGFGPDGVLYFGTYPNAMLMGYDPAAGELRSFGSLTNDAAYVFSVGIVGDEVWAGTGPVPHLFRVNPGTGEVSEMFPPDAVMENTDWFIDIYERGDYAFVRLSPRGGFDMAVYHLAEERWLDDVIEGTFAAPVSEVIDNKVYFLAGDVLTGFDLDTEEVFSTGFEDSWIHEEMADAVGTYGFTITEVPGDDFPGATVVGLNTDGHLWRYNLETGAAQLVPADVLGSPAGAHSMGVGPDGAVYMGAYLSSGAMSRIDPVTHEIEYGRGPKQGDAIVTHDNQLVVSSYPGAGVHIGSVDDGWAWSRMEHVLQLERGAPYYQDRIFAMVSAGDRLAVGSVPDYGQVGGALTLLDTATGDFEFHRDVIPGQSVTALAYADGLVYGGTSIHGGIDSTPTASEAEYFVWDVDASELVWHEVPVDGARIINQLTVGPDGQVWGLTNTGVVFVVDPHTHEVLDRISTGRSTGNVWGRTTSLYLNEFDGFMYGNSGGALFRIDPVTHEVDILVESGVRESAIDARGQIYFADSINVFAFGTAATPECTDTITGNHEGPLNISDGVTCIDDAVVDGPVTVTSGAGIVIVDSDVSGPLTVQGAVLVHISDAEIRGPVRLGESTGRIVLERNLIAGPLGIVGNTTSQAPLISDNTVTGPLTCSGNDPAPVDAGVPNSVHGPATGQCAGW